MSELVDLDLGCPVNYGSEGLDQWASAVEGSPNLEAGAALHTALETTVLTLAMAKRSSQGKAVGDLSSQVKIFLVFKMLDIAEQGRRGRSEPYSNTRSSEELRIGHQHGFSRVSLAPWVARGAETS
ncbi:hypothetical protein RRG08_010979 [Elysia crispata]|uniref:Uncharacterized protein n=1 Tax=Elysia crispata TaxID=231223 RepID=A0AAE0XVX9_9GAST|nr:hypothetical protein RRG08_010979 [Elysia crispata]